MGSICQKPQQLQNQYSMKAFVNDEAFDGLSLYFTTENLSRIDNQCLLIFTDAKSKINKNQFLRKVSKSTAYMIAEYTETQLNGRTLNPGECIIITISSAQLIFNKIAVLCLGVWRGQSHVITNPLTQCLQKSLDVIHQNSMSSVIITDYNEEFGIPVHVGQKCLMKAIYNQRRNFKVVTILTEKLQHQKNKIQAFEKLRSSLTVATSESEKESLYF